MSVFLHPAAVHESVVQASPSSQACVAPPAEHCPATQVLAEVNVAPLQVAAAQIVPSDAGLHAVVLPEVAQTRQASSGFGWVSPQQVPWMSQ